MSWNYRVVRSEENGEACFTIREAYYDDGQKRPHSITESPAYASGETVRELCDDLRRMLDAAERAQFRSKPDERGVLEDRDFPGIERDAGEGE